PTTSSCGRRVKVLLGGGILTELGCRNTKELRADSTVLFLKTSLQSTAGGTATGAPVFGGLLGALKKLAGEGFRLSLTLKRNR
ncbi:hypothetical protein P7K49_000684, partial [Saguinus oedipus]